MILFFYGEETYQSSQKVTQWKNEFLKKNPTGGGMVIFDCDEECNIAHITQSFSTQNLFAQKKLVIVENLFAHTKAPEQKEIIEKLEQSENSDVIVFVEKGKVRKNATLFKWLDKNAKTVKENLPLEGNILEKWIINEVKKGDKKIETNAVRELILFVGTDLWQLSQEIEKLICYTKKDTIIAQDVHDIVHGRTDGDMFEMIEGIVSNNKEKALTLLRKQIAAGDDTFYIFSMYAYQVRILLRVGDVKQNGVNDKDVIAKLLKLHPFVVQKSMSMLNNIPYTKIIKMHKKLTELDYDIKVGNRDIKTALNIFVVS